MIRGSVTHPYILSALASAGHKARILIADGHYSSSTNVNPRAQVVHLNLRPGLPTVTDVFDALAETIAIEHAAVIRASEDALPCVVQDELRARLMGLADGPVPMVEIERADFYDQSRGHELALCIVTGDTRRFGNVLLTVGVLRTE